MARPATGTKYTTIKIPEGLTLIIDAMIIKSKGNYTSRTDVIKTAVRMMNEREEAKEQRTQ